MATIYLARTTDGTRSQVAAVKVIRRELSEDENVERMFLDEASILGRLTHPNIIRTFEHGVMADQRYIAMELLVGHTLLDLYKACDARKLALMPELIAWIGARVADALQCAHELKDDRGERLNVIHRDVNPSNVFLTYDGGVKLIDFGLAKSSGARARSRSGIVKGKLPYLSPEQIMQLPIDGRTDIFALGTTMWEMAAMRKLFLRDSDGDTLKAVRVGPIPDLRGVSNRLPAALAAIIGKALERNRVHRYPTALALATDLDAFVRAGSSTDIPARIAATLEGLFPEERARQMGWLRQSLVPKAIASSG